MFVNIKCLSPFFSPVPLFSQVVADAVWVAAVVAGWVGNNSQDNPFINAI